MLKRGSWSFEELAKLRASFGRRPVEQLARELRRSVAALRERAHKSLARAERPGPLDTQDEATLAQMVGVASLDDMVLVLARAEAQIVGVLLAWRERRRGGRWTQRELAYLRVFGSKRPLWALELVTGRGARALLDRLDKLCLGFDRTMSEVPLPCLGEMGPGHDRDEKVVVLTPARSRRMPRWTSSDVERLRVLYPLRSNIEVARALDRSVKSVRAKALQLGLKKTKGRLEAMGRENVRLRYEGRKRR